MLDLLLKEFTLLILEYTGIVGFPTPVAQTWELRRGGWGAPP